MTSRFPGSRPGADTLQEGESIRVFVFNAEHCNPKRCSARRLDKFGMIESVDRLGRLPKKAILLDPFAKKALSREDTEQAESRGVCFLDCSWEQAERIFKKAKKIGRLTSRSLPYLLAANPINSRVRTPSFASRALTASCTLGGRGRGVQTSSPLSVSWTPSGSPARTVSTTNSGLPSVS